MTDKHTLTYFDNETPSYWPGLYSELLRVLVALGREGDCLVDVGCGTGTTLQLIQQRTAIRQLSGIDPSLNSLKEASDKGDFELIAGSILDDGLVASIGPRFRFAVLAFLLHHLIGRGRNDSREKSRAALINAARLVCDRGYLLILEEVVHPDLVAAYTFYLKKLLSSLTLKRIDPLKTGYSLGAPVVSYFTARQLRETVKTTPDLRVASVDVREKSLSALMRVAGITKLAWLTLVANKCPPR